MKNTQGEVWVFAEQEEGKLSDVPFELLGKARELASKLGVKVGAVLMGSGVESLAKPLFEAGADIVHIVDDPALKVYRNKAYRHAMVELVKEVNPQIAIFGATHMGRDLAPSVASALRCGLTADCTDLQIGDYEDKKTKETFTNVLHQIRPAFGGNIIATIVNARNWPQMATVREGVMKPLERGTGNGERGTVVRHSAHLDGVEIPVEVVEIVRKVSSVNLKGSRIIVCGGAGVGSKENFRLLHDLAGAGLGEDHRDQHRQGRADLQGRALRHRRRPQRRHPEAHQGDQERLRRAHGEVPVFPENPIVAVDRSGAVLL